MIRRIIANKAAPFFVPAQYAAATEVTAAIYKEVMAVQPNPMKKPGQNAAGFEGLVGQFANALSKAKANKNKKASGLSGDYTKKAMYVTKAVVPGEIPRQKDASASYAFFDKMAKGKSNKDVMATPYMGATQTRTPSSNKH